MNQKGFAQIILIVIAVIVVGTIGYFVLSKSGITNPSKFNVSEKDFNILGIEYTREVPNSGSVKLSVQTNRDNLVISAFSEDKQRCAGQFAKAGSHILEKCSGDPGRPFTVSQTNVTHNFSICASSPWDYEKNRGAQEVCKSITLSPANEQQNTQTTPTNWKIYTNNQYGFQLTFTDTWEAYSAVQKGNVIYFAVPTSDSKYANSYGKPRTAAPMTLAIYSKADWSKLSSEEQQGYNYINQNNNYVFVYSQWQEAPEDLRNFNFEVPKVISTFRFTK